MKPGWTILETNIHSLDEMNVSFYGERFFSPYGGISGLGLGTFVSSLTNNAIIEYPGNHYGRVVCLLIQWNHNWDGVTKCVLINLNRSFKISTIRFLIHQISGCISEQYSRNGILNYGEKYRTDKKRNIRQHGWFIGCILHFEMIPSYTWLNK